MNPLELLHTHLRLECIGLDANERMVRIPGPDAIPRFYAALWGGRAFYCRHDVPAEACARWRGMTPDIFLGWHDEAQVSSMVGEQVATVWAGYSYVFTRAPWPAEAKGADRLTPLGLSPANQARLAALDPDLDPATRRIFGVFLCGELVAMCASTRENDEAAEAWVKTLPEFRRRGYARAAVAGWAGSVLADGKLAFYSHRADNRASQALALGLGLTPYIEDVAFD
jgi:hypothetical protein